MTAAPHHIEAGEGPPLVLMHGVGGDAHSWDMQLEHFGRSNRAIAWDMPGYGGSAPIAPMTFPALAESLAALLDALDIESAHLLGHSMGGMVAQEFAARWPERVTSMILSATSAAFGNPDGDFQKKFVAARLKPLDDGAGMADLAREMVAQMFGADADPRGAELARACFASVPEATYRAAIECLVGFERRDALAGYRMPILVLAGEADTNAPAPMMEKLASKIAGAHYKCLPGAGHLANLEQPSAFNQAVEEFLESQGS